MLQLQVRDRAADRFCQGDGLFGVEPRQQDDELLTAIARRDVAGALAVGGEHCRDLAQALVTEGVAVAVVDPLEVIDIGEQHR